jgi:N-acetylated-alpha-linked acidic dipeptidase
MANADVLPFDFTHLYNTVKDYVNDLSSLLQTSRESTQLENQVIRSGTYSIGEDPTKKYIVPVTKPEVPYLNFSPLQNALEELKNSGDSLKIAFEKKIESESASAVFNQSLYRAEQQLLNESGLPGRAWYKHTLYAPGLYTGYGVKTMPGIREAIEQRNWKVAQEQIDADAKTINNLSGYLMRITRVSQ